MLYRTPVIFHEGRLEDQRKIQTLGGRLQSFRGAHHDRFIFDDTGAGNQKKLICTASHRTNRYAVLSCHGSPFNTRWRSTSRGLRYRPRHLIQKVDMAHIDTTGIAVQ
jgi:hypothetical protein